MHQLYSTTCDIIIIPSESWLIKFTYLFLPDLEAIDVDVVLDVLKGPSEAIHPLGQCFQLGFQLSGLCVDVCVCVCVVG